MTVVVALIVGAAIGAAAAWYVLRRRLTAAPAVDVPDVRNEVVVLPAEEALASLPLGVVVANTGGQIVYRNRVAQQFHDGRHSDVLVDSAIRDLIAIVDTAPIEREIELYGPPRRNLRLERTPIILDDRTVGTTVTVEDVTERRRVETVRRDFVANVSHELKTPVGAIGILAETLSQSDDPAVTTRLADRLQAETLRLGVLIDDLLALSRIESGEHFHDERVEVGQVIGNVVDRVAAVADQRNITLQVVGTDPDLAVQGDRRQLTSAIANLVDNAIKYSDDDSTIVVSTHRQDRRVVIDVRDTGIGIPEADLSRVFERFYRVDPGRGRDTGGTGLGLSIVRHVVLNHGGDIKVDSTEGVGTTFTLFLPCAEPEPEEPMAEGADGGADLVDDDVAGRDVGVEEVRS